MVVIAGSSCKLRPSWSWKKMKCWWNNSKFNKLKQKTVTDNVFKKVKCCLLVVSATPKMVLQVWGLVCSLGFVLGFFFNFINEALLNVHNTKLWMSTDSEVSVWPLDALQHALFWLASSEKGTGTVKEQYAPFHNLRALETLQVGICEVFAYLKVPFRIYRFF